MKIGPLKLFARNQGGMTIAALHWRNSITWRWVLDWKPVNTLIPYGVSLTRTYRYKPGLNGSFTLNLPLLGYFHLTMQPNMFQPGWKAYS